MGFIRIWSRATAVYALVSSTVVALQAQSAPAQMERSDRLIVPEGAPLRVIVTGKVRFKKNQPVHGRIVEPVYAFDREVVPVGAEVEGRITGFKSAPRWVRITSMLGGNFTPLREPEVTFDTLMLSSVRSIPIQTSVTPGTDTMVRFTTGAAEE